jgi:hypothetical protein
MPPMSNPAIILGALATGFALLSFLLLSVANLPRWIAATLAFTTTSSGFLWAAWLLRGAGAASGWHAAMGLVAVLFAAALWSKDRAQRWFGVSFAVFTTALLALSAFAFPAYLQATLDEAAKGKPFCVVDRRETPLAARDVTFLGVTKAYRGSIWSPKDSPPTVWFPLTAFVRTGEPQLRSDYVFKFEFPPGLYDLAIYSWSPDAAGFTTTTPSSIARQIPCIPRTEGLYAERDPATAEYATAWGDFVVPLAFSPARLSDSLSIDFSVSGLLDGNARPDEEPSFAFLSFGYRDSELNRAGLFDRDTALAQGFVPDEGDSSLLDEEQRYTRMRFAPDGRPISELECWKESDSPRNCTHMFVADETEAGFSTSIQASYASDHAPRWLEIEAKLRLLMTSFAVPGPIPVDQLRPRSLPECKGEGEGGCEAYDRLP